MRIRNIPFQVVGVLAPKGFNLFGQDQDDIVVVPYTSHMHRITTRTFVNDILVQASDDKSINQASGGNHRIADRPASQQGTRLHRAHPAGLDAARLRVFPDDGLSARGRRGGVARSSAASAS